MFCGERKGDCRLFVMDVDGTLTDGKIIVGQNGELAKAFNAKDGLGIKAILPVNHIVPIVITGRESSMVKARCDELGVREIYQGVSDKVSVLQSIADRLDCAACSIAYIGDDLNDIECMKWVKNGGGIIGAPHDAVDDVKKIADYICFAAGGEGAVREFIDWICGDVSVLS